MLLEMKKQKDHQNYQQKHVDSSEQTLLQCFAADLCEKTEHLLLQCHLLVYKHATTCCLRFFVQFVFGCSKLQQLEKLSKKNQLNAALGQACQGNDL